MRDEEVRQLQPLLQIHQQLHDLRLHRHVQRRDGLVGDQERRVQRQRAREADPLPLASAELARIAAGASPARARRASAARRRAPRVRRPIADPMDDERFFDNRADAHPRIQRASRDPGRRSASRRRAARSRSGSNAQDILSLEPDLAGRRLDEPQDAAARRRLAAARLTDEAERLPCVESKTTRRPRRSSTCAASNQPRRRVEALREVRHLDERHQLALRGVPPGRCAEASSSCVYGCCGARKMSATAPSSTMRPALHDGDAVGHRRDDAEIVRDQQQRQIRTARRMLSKQIQDLCLDRARRERSSARRR